MYIEALSINQPFAWLISYGFKPVENRSWYCRFRGRFMVHASKKVDKDGIAWVKLNFPDIILPKEFAIGGIVGQAEIVDCVTEMDSPWFFGEYGFVIANARPVPFQPLRGQLGFFKVWVPDETMIQAAAPKEPKETPLPEDRSYIGQKRRCAICQQSTPMYWIPNEDWQRACQPEHQRQHICFNCLTSRPGRTGEEECQQQPQLNL